MANIYDERSENHAGYNEGTKVETTVDHHEVNRDLSSGKIFRVIAVDENGLEWTLPLHSIKEYHDSQATSDIDVNNEK